MGPERSLIMRMKSKAIPLDRSRKVASNHWGPTIGRLSAPSDGLARALRHLAPRTISILKDVYYGLVRQASTKC
jgi:hypothetical protein